MNEQQLFDKGELMMNNDVLRTAVMRIMSEMLDNPSENGIYPTGRFMDQIECLIESLMAAPEVMQLSGSEAVFGFASWLTTASRFEQPDFNPNFGPTQDAAPWSELVDEFCKTNKLAEPREMWGKLLTHPNDYEK